MIAYRKKNFILGTGSSYLSTLISILIGIISVPIGLKYFGIERYGALAIIGTLITYLSVSNFGIPSAVSVLAAKTLDKTEQMRIVAKAFLILSLITIVALLAFLILTSNDSWINVIGKIPSGIFLEVRNATFAATVLFLINLPVSVFLMAFIATQKVWIERVYSSISNILTLACLFITIALEGNLVFYMIIRGLLVIAVNIISALHFLFFNEENKNFFRNKKITNLFQASKEDEFSVKSILITGTRFFAIGLAAMIVWQTDNLVISHFIGLKGVTPYSITFKLITTAFVGFTAVNAVLGPMYGSACAVKDYGWIEKTYNNISALTSILGGMVWIGSIAFAREIINAWAGPAGYGGILTVFALGGYGYSLSLVNVHSSLMSGMNLLKNGVTISWSEAAVNLVLSLLFVRYFGIGGVALGTFLAAILTVFWMIPLEIYRRTEGSVKFSYQPVVKHFLLIVLPALACVMLTMNYVPNILWQLSINSVIILIYAVLSYRNLSTELRVLLLEFYTKTKNRLVRVK
jgi:O-antigen/teichoic acid export membrane protein